MTTPQRPPHAISHYHPYSKVVLMPVPDYFAYFVTFYTYSYAGGILLCLSNDLALMVLRILI